MLLNSEEVAVVIPQISSFKIQKIIGEQIINRTAVPQVRRSFTFMESVIQTFYFCSFEQFRLNSAGIHIFWSQEASSRSLIAP